MTNHTPAPWVVDEDGDIIGVKSRGYCVAAGDVAGIGIDNPADRDLILAAPDMYEALEEVRNFMDTLGIWAPKTYERVCDALKKARGEV